MRLRREGVSWQRLDDGAVLLDLTTSTYFTVNETGADIIDALAGSGEGVDTGALELLLLRGYDVTPERARADVADMLAELARRGLVEPAGA